MCMGFSEYLTFRWVIVWFLAIMVYWYNKKEYFNFKNSYLKVFTGAIFYVYSLDKNACVVAGESKQVDQDV